MPMGVKGTMVGVLLFCAWFFEGFAEDVKVTVGGVTSIAETDDNFICATIDWWPADKCDYNQCPWGLAGIFNLDLQNIILVNAIKAFDNLRIRMGGSLQDQILYQIGYAIHDCPQIKKVEGGLFGFSEGCLTMQKWDEVNKLINQTGALFTFGLNALIGKNKPEPPPKGDNITWTGDWDSQNARDLIEYTLSKGYKIDSYELGNELCGSGVSARLDAKQYAKDLVKLRQTVKDVYQKARPMPKIMGPAGFYDKEWFDTFLEAAGPHAVDGLSHHTYNLGPGVDPTLINKVQDPYFLSQIAQTYKDISDSIRLFGPWASAWIGEAGGAYNSGGKDVSHTFANGFWYLDQLGMSASFNHKVFCRQSLIGGNYGLLDTTSFIPNPDYYGALLWHRLMGKRVLSTSQNDSPYLRVYSHCAKQKPGISMLIINMSNSTWFQVQVQNDMNLHPTASESNGGQEREEYHLTPQNGDIQSDKLLLNGNLLSLTEASDIPEMKPKLVDPSSAIVVAPDSFVYATLRDFKAPTCM
ncbi:unnamed protein product, partial [Vitis vinifera]|uniref:Heparanase-like protein 2 n=2 Tax=Vitis vinifera TaxID=29760 RepID=D7T9T6_VITVI